MNQIPTLMGQLSIGRWSPEEQDRYERARDLLQRSASLHAALGGSHIEAERQAQISRGLLLSHTEEIDRILRTYPAAIEALERALP